jgi:predicted phage terminase large subunit-like protein
LTQQSFWTSSHPSETDPRWLNLAPAVRRLFEDALNDREEETECLTLGEYVEQAWPIVEPSTEFLPNWHIDAIAEYLEAVTEGQITRLLINMPPRYGKSLLVSVMWPTWEWVANPETRFLFASYSASLSTKHSVDRRTIIQSEWYQERWGTRFRLSGDQNVKTEFQNDCRGVMVATSIGGTATGKGGNRLVIDDPHDPQKAESEVQRESAIRFFDRTLSNRLDDKKRDAIVVVMQRLHESDLSARCLELGYTHLCLPAESEGPTVVAFPSGREVSRSDGELLWPEREGPAEIVSVKAALGSYAYAGQYQQRPAPAGGGMFKREWFPIVEASPVAVAARCRFWDMAATSDGDYTVGVKMARSKEGLFYIEDVTRGRWTPFERDKIILQTAQLDGTSVAIYVEQEPGSAGKSVTDAMIRMLVGYPVYAERPTGDKQVRATPFAAQCEAGNVRLVKNIGANHAFIDEHASFPFGKHDDQVDTRLA